MIEAGLGAIASSGAKRVHQSRYRRDCVGELVQVDGCEHWWFEDCGPQCTLLVFVDDATGRLMHLQELRLAGACTLAEGNALLPAFTADCNARFAKPPAHQKDLHRPTALAFIHKEQLRREPERRSGPRRRDQHGACLIKVGEFF
jgi:hypothetical protein